MNQYHSSPNISVGSLIHSTGSWGWVECISIARVAHFLSKEHSFFVKQTDCLFPPS